MILQTQRIPIGMYLQPEIDQSTLVNTWLYYLAAEAGEVMVGIGTTDSDEMVAYRGANQAFLCRGNQPC